MVKSLHTCRFFPMSFFIKSLHSHTFSYILHFSLSLSPPILKDMQQVYVEPLETDRETGRGTWESSLLSWMRGGVPLQGPPARDAARGLKDHVVRSGWSGRPPIWSVWILRGRPPIAPGSIDWPISRTFQGPGRSPYFNTPKCHGADQHN